MINVFGRLKPGTTLDQTRSEMTLLAARQQTDHAEAFPPGSRSTLSPIPIADELYGEFRPTLRLLFGTVVMVLLITCANVGNLALARLLRREREMVLRSALGASQRRLVRQLLTESTALALLGGLAGLAFAGLATRPMVAFARRFTPLADQVRLDGRVLLFTLGVALATGLLSGLLPALHAGRGNLAALLRAGGQAAAQPNSRRLRSALVVLQVATSFVLLIAAGLTAESARRLQQVDGGFDPKNVTAVSLQLPTAKYPEPSKTIAFYSSLLARIDTLPGVVSSAVASAVPLMGDTMTPGFRIENRAPAPGEELRAGVRTVSPGYLRTLGVPLIAGRLFLPTDDVNAPPVVLISRSMARHFWPGGDPLGHRVLIQQGTSTWATIVGVVGDIRQDGLDAEAGHALYRPFLASGGVSMTLFVRTAAAPQHLAPAVRAVVREIDPEQSMSAPETLEELKSETTAPSRLTATLFALFGIVAFAITIAGVNAVIAYATAERTQELGIRSALGADRGDLLRLVMGQGMALVVLGLALGWVGAFGGTRFLASLLFATQTNDPLTFFTASLVLLACGAVACFFPARLATVLAPSVALRR
jgi:putative ABC transport system permease protein